MKEVDDLSERVTTNETDIDWIKQSIVRLEKKSNKIKLSPTVVTIFSAVLIGIFTWLGILTNAIMKIGG